MRLGSWHVYSIDHVVIFSSCLYLLLQCVHVRGLQFVTSPFLGLPVACNQVATDVRSLSVVSKSESGDGVCTCVLVANTCVNIF